MTALFWTMLVFRMVWLLGVIAGTAYIVFWLGYSGWWWLLAFLLMAGGEQTTKER